MSAKTGTIVYIEDAGCIAEIQNKVNSRTFCEMKSFHKLNFDEHEVLESMDEEHVIGHGGSNIVYRLQLSNRESIAVKKL